MNQYKCVMCVSKDHGKRIIEKVAHRDVYHHVFKLRIRVAVFHLPRQPN